MQLLSLSESATFVLMNREDIKFDLGKNRLPQIGKRYALRVVLYTVILILLALWYKKRTQQAAPKNEQTTHEIEVTVEPIDTLSR